MCIDIHLILCIHLFAGVGKSHSDAASVRTANPIPPACGLYYFEVKIISKGRDGYMGIGLTSQTFRMDRLPGKLEHLVLIRNQNQRLKMFLNLCVCVSCRLGQAIVRLSRRRWQLVLLVGQRPTVRSDIHHRRHYRMRRESGQQHLFLHKERPSSGHCLPRSARKYSTA